jgi:hypothetical protein
MNKSRQYAQRAILRMKKTDVTGHAGALMGSTVWQNRLNYSGSSALKIAVRLQSA